MELKGNVGNGYRNGHSAGLTQLLKNNPFTNRSKGNETLYFMDLPREPTKKERGASARHEKKMWVRAVVAEVKGKFSAKSEAGTMPNAVAAKVKTKEKRWNDPSYFHAGVYYGPGMSAKERVFFDLHL